MRTGVGGVAVGAGAALLVGAAPLVGAGLALREVVGAGEGRFVAVAVGVGVGVGVVVRVADGVGVLDGDVERDGRAECVGGADELVDCEDVSPPEPGS